MTEGNSNDIRYCLTIPVFAETPEIEITPAEFKEAKKGKKLLVDALGIEESINLVFENYLEWGMELLGSALRSLVHKPDSWSDFSGRIHEANRRLVNLLSGGRGYLDQSRHFLSERYGKDSEELDRFNQWASEEYDTYLGFRAMEALRNYAQHRGLAVNALSYQLWVDGEVDHKVRRNALAAYMSPALLAEDEKFNPKVLAELSEIGKQVDLRPLVDEFVAGIARIHFKLREAIREQAERADEHIRNLIERYKAEGQEKTVGLVAAQVDRSGLFLDEVQLFEDLTTRRKFLIRRTLHAPHLAGINTTNEPNK